MVLENKNYDEDIEKIKWNEKKWKKIEIWTNGQKKSLFFFFEWNRKKKAKKIHVQTSHVTILGIINCIGNKPTAKTRDWNTRKERKKKRKKERKKERKKGRKKERKNMLDCETEDNDRINSEWRLRQLSNSATRQLAESASLKMVSPYGWVFLWQRHCKRWYYLMVWFSQGKGIVRDGQRCRFMVAK